MPKPHAPPAEKTRPAYVYILRCADDSFYCGSCYDITARIAKHDQGRGAKYTRGRGPLELCYLERCSSWGQALRRELQIKKLGRKGKEKLVAGWQAGDG